MADQINKRLPRVEALQGKRFSFDPEVRPGARKVTLLSEKRWDFLILKHSGEIYQVKWCGNVTQFCTERQGKEKCVILVVEDINLQHVKFFTAVWNGDNFPEAVEGPFWVHEQYFTADLSRIFQEWGIFEDTYGKRLRRRELGIHMRKVDAVMSSIRGHWVQPQLPKT